MTYLLTLVGIFNRKLWYTNICVRVGHYIMYGVFNFLYQCVKIVFLDTENIVEIVIMLRSELDVK